MSLDSQKDEINPYAAPAVIEVPATGALPTDAVSKYGAYRDNRTLTTWLIGLLVFGIVVFSLRGVLDVAYSVGSFGTDANQVAVAEGIMKGASLVMIATRIVFGVWIVRAAKNAWLFAEVTRVRARIGFHVKQAFLSDTPGWAVGWYFIPIANLWKPYTAMRDIVAASTMRQGLPSFLLPTWWTLWIVSNLSDNANGYLNSPTMVENVGPRVAAWIVIAGLKVSLHIIAIVLVRSIATLQTDTATEMAESPLPDLQPS